MNVEEDLVEEKKSDEGDVAAKESLDLLEVASPAQQPAFKSNIDGILFADEPPPSPPDLSTFTNTSALVKRVLKEDAERSDSEEASETEKVPGTPPFKPRTVKFNIAESPQGASYNFDEASEESLLDRLTKTQERLTQAQIDLSGEKARRKRKEKNMVKLAKELQKRAGILETKDQEISKMTTMITIAMNKQREAADALKSAEEKHRSSLLDFEARISTLTTQHMAECATLEQKYRSTCASHESQLQSTANEKSSQEANWKQQYAQAKLDYDSEKAALESQYETMLSQLRLEILQANVDSDQLRSKVKALESGDVSYDEISVSSRSLSAARSVQHGGACGLLAWTMVLVLTLVIATPVLLVVAIRYDLLREVTFLHDYIPHMEYLTMDSLCAPVLPGTRLEGDGLLVEAPWWAAPELKVAAYKFCSDRPRIRLELKGNKLSARDATTEETIWSEKARSAQVEREEIIMYNRWGQEKTRKPLPWVTEMDDTLE